MNTPEPLRTLFQRPDQVHQPLYVLTPIFNPARYRSRWKLHEDFKWRVEKAGAILYEVEVAFGERDFVFTTPDNPRQLQLRTQSELWLKENAINLLERKLPHDWRYVAWIDGDVTFVRDDWANETLHALQRYDFVQMWSHFQDLNYESEAIGSARSFMQSYIDGGTDKFQIVNGKRIWIDDPESPYAPYAAFYGKRGYPGAPGLAWACTRKAWNTTGGLLDTAILGACDWYMAHGIIGEVSRVIRKEYTPQFRATILEWQERALTLHKNIGVVKGMALHHWHGPKKFRKYATRDQILINAHYNPYSDLTRDQYGLYHLNPRSIELRDGIRQYFNERNEDQI